MNTGGFYRRTKERIMKHLKMLGLAAIAALGLMAFVGAGSASATTLFTSSNLTGPYGVGTATHATLTTGSSVTLAGVTCTESTFSGKTATDTGTAVSMGGETWSFGMCSNTIFALSAGSLDFEKTGANEAKVIGRGAEWTVTLIGTTCTYGTGLGTTLGTIIGGTAPILKINSIGLKKIAGSVFCPVTAEFSAEYTFTSPHAMFIGV